MSLQEACEAEGGEPRRQCGHHRLARDTLLLEVQVRIWEYMREELLTNVIQCVQAKNYTDIPHPSERGEEACSQWAGRRETGK